LSKRLGDKFASIFVAVQLQMCDSGGTLAHNTRSNPVME
jgi:hypothetical protein